MLYSSTTGAGKDLVLLHGWGFNSDLFNNLINLYQDQYRITKIDLPVFLLPINTHTLSSAILAGLNFFN